MTLINHFFGKVRLNEEGAVSNQELRVRPLHLAPDIRVPYLRVNLVEISLV